MDFLVSFAISIPLALFFTAIIFHETILEWIGNFLCKHGKHRFKKKKYNCKRCGKPRDWPVLKCIRGGKRNRPKFPGV